MDAFTKFFINTILDVLLITIDGDLQKAVDILNALIKDYNAEKKNCQK